MQQRKGEKLGRERWGKISHKLWLSKALPSELTLSGLEELLRDKVYSKPQVKGDQVVDMVMKAKAKGLVLQQWSKKHARTQATVRMDQYTNAARLTQARNMYNSFGMLPKVELLEELDAEELPDYSQEQLELLYFVGGKVPPWREKDTIDDLVVERSILESVKAYASALAGGESDPVGLREAVLQEAREAHEEKLVDEIPWETFEGLLSVYLDSIELPVP